MVNPIQVKRETQSFVGGASYPTRNFTLLRKLNWAKNFSEARGKFAADADLPQLEDRFGTEYPSGQQAVLNTAKGMSAIPSVAARQEQSNPAGLVQTVAQGWADNLAKAPGVDSGSGKVISPVLGATGNDLFQNQHVLPYNRSSEVWKNGVIPATIDAGAAMLGIKGKLGGPIAQLLGQYAGTAAATARVGAGALGYLPMNTALYDPAGTRNYQLANLSLQLTSAERDVRNNVPGAKERYASLESQQRAYIANPELDNQRDSLWNEFVPGAADSVSTLASRGLSGEMAARISMRGASSPAAALTAGRSAATRLGAASGVIGLLQAGVVAGARQFTAGKYTGSAAGFSTEFAANAAPAVGSAAAGYLIASNSAKRIAAQALQGLTAAAVPEAALTMRALAAGAPKMLLNGALRAAALPAQIVERAGNVIGSLIPSETNKALGDQAISAELADEARGSSPIQRGLSALPAWFAGGMDPHVANARFVNMFPTASRNQPYLDQQREFAAEEQKVNHFRTILADQLPGMQPHAVVGLTTVLAEPLFAMQQLKDNAAQGDAGSLAALHKELELKRQLVDQYKHEGGSSIGTQRLEWLLDTVGADGVSTALNLDDKQGTPVLVKAWLEGK